MPDLGPARLAWLEARRNHIGGSDSPAIVGASPWSSGWEVWARLTGRVPNDIVEPEAEERMHWGTVLERPVLRELSRRIGEEVIPADQTVHVIHPEIAVMAATPDGYIGDDGLAEAKTSLGWGAKHVWEEGVPLDYQVQVQHQLAVTGREYALVAVLRTGPRFDIHRIERHEGAISMLEETIPRWWREHVEADTPPPVDAHPATIRALEALHRGRVGGTVELGEEGEIWAAKLEEIGRRKKELEEDERAVKAQIKAALGAAEAGRLPGGGGWTWRVQERKEHTVKASSSRVLRRVKKL